MGLDWGKVVPPGGVVRAGRSPRAAEEQRREYAAAGRSDQST